MNEALANQWLYDKECDMLDYLVQKELDLIMDDDVYRYLFEQHQSKQRPSQTHGILTNQRSFYRRLGDYEEVDVKIDLEVELIDNIELKSIMNESVGESIHFLAITREVPTEETDESQHVARNVDVMTIKNKATSLESTKVASSYLSIVEQTTNHCVEDQLDTFGQVVNLFKFGVMAYLLLWGITKNRSSLRLSKCLLSWKNKLLYRPEASNRWIRPDNGRVKCNYDASVSIDDNATTYVVVLRDYTGNFVKGYTSFSHTKMEPHMVEGMVIQEALSWLKSLNLDRVVAELDCLKVILT
ncbi:hypothetical protein Golob_011983 [Gossypium lobatum]|uniref:RNase H type-1 domain-containing protein n=1 Tax=Gossypium lobatum TaxID=34289 RepID=A0A7J8MRN0_9ROSI|nr:hypothetical protein [Gossypium lobatum]